MKRTLFDRLMIWNSSVDRKPLVIRGARQVGKTWLMKEFGRQAYEHIAYVNFESDPSLKGLFQQDYNISRLLSALQIATEQPIHPGKTLIILDEIQEGQGAITALKYFQEDAPEYHVISAGSLLGVALGNETSFPVGKVEFLDLYPLNFHEFLLAHNEQSLADLITHHDWPLITTFKDRFIERLRQYYFVGGMPEVVDAFVQRGDFQEVRQIQRNILLGYEQDFSKHVPSNVIPRIRMLWNTIPAQLAKENKKFIYGLIKAGARAKEYEIALAWLVDCGLTHKIHNVTKPAVPLKAYESLNAFKLYMLDVGLLSAMVQIEPKSLIEGGKIFDKFKGALTEQFVAQQLLTNSKDALYYWSADNARAEIDFLVQENDEVIPIEVKAAENLQSKSLRVYCDKYAPNTAVRTSLSDYRQESWMINIPLYAISSLLLE